MPNSEVPVLDWLLLRANAIDPAPLPTIHAWKARFVVETGAYHTPADFAIIGGFLADRLAYAFAAGYQAALRRLVPALQTAAWPEPFAALCVTEQGGGHPRNIQTRLEALSDGTWRLNGQKTFVTNANEAQVLLIAATTGSDQAGRNQLRLMLVERETAGVTITPLPDLAFVPEISHGLVTLDNVILPAAAVLDGDGYTQYVKPFRTVEDAHVFAGTLAYLFRLACLSGWADAVKAQLIALLLTAHTLANSDPSAPAIHFALEGLIHQMRALIAALDWSAVDGETYGRWQRDAKLLTVAESVRAARFANALAYYGLG